MVLMRQLHKGRRYIACILLASLLFGTLFPNGIYAVGEINREQDEWFKVLSRLTEQLPEELGDAGLEWEFVPEEGPGSVEGEDPGSGTGEEPGSVGGEDPGSGAGEEPGSVGGEDPGSGTGEEPGSVGGENPGSGAGEEPKEDEGGEKPDSETGGDRNAAAGALHPPVLDPLPEASRDAQLVISGLAALNAEVTVYLSRNGEQPYAAGTGYASEDEGDGQGRFTLSLQLEEGSYEITASAEWEGEVSQPSPPVQVLIDRTPPDAYSMDVTWRSVGHDGIELLWEAPLVENPQRPGEYISDAIDRYVLERQDGTLLAESEERSYLDLSLQEFTYYYYRLYAVDKAGNRSEALPILASTFHRNAFLVTGVEQGLFTTPIISRNGKVIVYNSSEESKEGIYAYNVETRETEFLAPSVFAYTNQGLAVSSDGRYVAYELADPDGYRRWLHVHDRFSGQSRQWAEATGERFSHLSISDDGTLVSFVSSASDLVPNDTNEAIDVFLARQLEDGTIEITRISETPDGIQATANSTEAAMSANGRHVAFVSLAPELVPGVPSGGYLTSQLHIYDTVSGELQHISTRQSGDSSDWHVSMPQLSSDGRYIVYRDGLNGRWFRVSQYDRTTGSFTTIQNTVGRSISLGAPSLSDDGKYVAFDYFNNDFQPNPEPFVSRFGSIRFETKTGDYQWIGRLGSSTMNIGLSGDGGKAIFMAPEPDIPGSEQIYYVCLEECEDREPTGPLSAASWNAPQNAWIETQLKQGTAITIQATGEQQLQVEALVAYRQLAAGNPGETEEKTIVITLAETAPGVYRSIYVPEEGVAEVTAITARLADGSGGRSVGNLPVRMAGKLHVSIDTEQLPFLDGAELLIESQVGNAITVPVGRSSSSYKIDAASGDNYSVTLQIANQNLILAKQDGVAVRSGEEAEVVLNPVFPATLKVTVRGIQGGSELPTVYAKDPFTGEVIVEEQTHSSGNVWLSGGFTAGQVVVVGVNPPPGFLADSPRGVALGVGENEITFSIRPASSQIQTARMQFSEEAVVGSHRSPVIGSEGELIVTGEAGLDLRALVLYYRWKDSEEEEQKEEQTEEELEVILQEGEPGVYTGTFAIAEGMSAINSFKLQAGPNQLQQVYPVQRNVAGRMVVRLDVPQDEAWRQQLQTAALTANYSFNPAVKHTERRNVKLDDPVFVFNTPFSQVDYAMVLFPQSASLLRTKTYDIRSPKYGTIEETVIKPTLQVQTQVNVTGEDGTPVNVQYSVTADGAVVASGKSQSQGRFSFGIPLVEGALFSLSVTPTDPAYHGTVIEQAADQLNMQLPIVLQKRQETKLQGRVLSKEGKPVERARVTATVTQDKFSKTYTAYSGADGTYAITLPAGEIQVRASHEGGRTGGMSILQVVDAQPDQVSTVDLTILDYGKLKLDIHVKRSGGEWEGPLSFGPQSVNNRFLELSRPLMDYGDPLIIQAVEGDAIEVCFRGTSLRLPRSCGTAVFNEQGTAEVALRLENINSEMVGYLVKPDGTPANYTRFDLKKKKGDSWTLLEQFWQYEPQFSRQLPESGDYRLQLTHQGLTTTVEFTAQASQRIDLGSIMLQPSGQFNGHEGNSFYVESEVVTPGSLVTARFEYNNRGLPQKVENARMVLEVPEEMNLVQGSAVLKGRPVGAVELNREIEISLGDIPFMTSGRASMQLRVQPADQVNLALRAKVRYSMNGIEHEEIVGTSIVQVLPLTIRAPKVVNSPQFKVNGSAPAGSVVTVFDGNAELGQALASPIGTWYMDVELAETNRVKHRLRTELLWNGGRFGGETALVRHEPEAPKLLEVIMEQPGASKYSFRPEAGHAVFPFTTIPDFFSPFVFKLTFSNPERVKNVRVHLGNNLGRAYLQNGYYVASIRTTGAKSLGPVEIMYDTVMEPWDPGSYSTPQGEEEIRDSINPFWRNYEVKAAQFPSQPERGVHRAILDTTVSDGIETRIDYTLRQLDAYTPTQADLNKAAQAGVPVYGVKTSASIGRQQAEITFEAIVPLSALPQQETDDPAKLFEAAIKAMSLPGAESLLTGSVKSIGAVIQVGIKMSFQNPKQHVDVLWDGFNAYWNLKSAGEETVIFDRVSRDLIWAQNLCDADAIRYYSDWATEIGNNIMINETIKWGLTAVAAAVGPASFGVGSALLFGFQYVAGKILDDAIEYQLDQLEENLAKQTCLERPRRPHASPVYIFDPSGYVYEGLHDNRVQGATATALQLNEETGIWEEWDAEWFGQQNPLITDADGRYAWDVPEGLWQVRYEKEGYQTAYSDELRVLPPHFDVNIPLISTLPPEVTYVRVLPGGKAVEAYFSKPIDAASIDGSSITVRGSGGADVSGTTALLGPVNEGGQELSMAIVFTPDQPLTVGQRYDVTIHEAISSYAGIPLAASVTRSITVEGQDTVPPGEISGLSGGVTDGIAVLTWEEKRDPDLSSVTVRWKAAGQSEYSPPVEVQKGTGFAVVESDKLNGSGGYDFVVRTVDEYGNESTGIVWSWQSTGSAADLTPPAPVQMLEPSQIGRDRFTVSWRDPAAPDLAALRLSWQREGTDEEAKTAEIVKEVQTYELTGLRSGTAYRVTIAALDQAGNESPATSIVVKTADSPRGGGGGYAGPINPGDGEEPGLEGQWSIGADGGEFTAFDGRLKLLVQAGVFEPGTDISYKQLPMSDIEADALYRVVSPAYVLDAGEAKPAGPVQLTIQYEEGSLDGADPRRLGLYRRDESTSVGWTYIGGLVDPEQNEISSMIDELGQYAVMLYEKTFADIQKHWSKEEIEVMASRHLIDGTAPDTFEPDRPIKRSEMIKLLVEWLRQRGRTAPGTGEGTVFSDVPPAAWYAPYVSEAAAIGLAEGADGLFRPDDILTRQELAVLLYRFVGLAADGTLNPAADRQLLARYEDGDAVAEWAIEAFAHAVSEGWIRGMTETELLPQGHATRAQAAVMLLRVLESMQEISKR